MFLLPALGSFAADALVVFVHSKYNDLLEPEGLWSIQNTSYLPPLSIIRLLLLLPLNYHVYSGTRLKFPFLYGFLHTTAAIAVLCHFFAFSILASENFSNFYVPTFPKSENEVKASLDDGEDTNFGSDKLDEILEQKVSDEIKEYDIIWILLTLSLVSIGLHVMILLHVRSSAPTSNDIKRQLQETNEASHDKSKRLGYWIYSQYRKRDRERNATDGISIASDSESDLESGLSEVSSIDGGSERGPLFAREYENSDSENDGEMDAFITHDLFDGKDSSDIFRSTPRRRRNRARTSSSGIRNSLSGLIGIHECFSTGYDDFMGEIRGRFKKARRTWSSRLDEFTNRMRQNDNGSTNTNANNLLTKFKQNTPFRALLQMYAHEEVFMNHRLDMAFPKGDSMELSFYAPQLLCFLLHNAFWLTGKLEKWILDRCKTDVHFAHRCFWFLRAWCLQGGIFIEEQDLHDSPVKRSDSLPSSAEFTGLSIDGQERSHSEPDFTNVKNLIKGPSTKDLEKSNGIKFSPEERDALEALLRKIIAHGELAARELEFGLLKTDLKHAGAGQQESSPLGSSFIPIDPSQEYPTIGHINAMDEIGRHGFLPHSKSSLRLDHQGQPVRSYFFRGTDFLDSLINIADDLLLQSSSNRTPELRKRLKELEFSMLPSNSIYVPVNGYLHRVWRILSSESIALSTKERVPCIIYLEVIDHSRGTTNTGDDVLRDWYTAKRQPQRLNTLFSKVEKRARLGLKKLKDEFEENQEKIFNRMNGSLTRSMDEEIIVDSLLECDNPIDVDVNSPGRYESPSSSLHEMSPSSDRSSPTAKLGQWLSPSHRKKLGRRDSPSEYGATELPSLTSTLGDESSDIETNSSGDSSSRRSPLVVFKEDWAQKEQRLRLKSAQGKNPNWRLLPILIKSNDDLRQEQLASQLIKCMATILANGRVPVWLYPYDIVALSFRGGIMEAIPDTISIDSLRKNHPHFTDMKHFFEEHFGKPGSDSYENAKANFVESLAAYSMICFLLQIKDRHNGNILLDNKGHIIHIDFGFYFLSSPGKNSGFESAPFKLTSEFIEVMDGVNSHTFSKFRELCYKTFIELRRNCFQITLLVQMLAEGNEDLDCFRGRPHDAIDEMQQRFRLDLNDRACQEYVNTLIDNSVGNWTTTCYDRYQRWFTGVM